MKQRTILNKYGKANTAFLHARGWIATKFLVQKLDCQPNERVLEIGFGTGATLVELASRNRETQFFGVEANQVMHAKARQRVKFCGMSGNIQCVLNQHTLPLPFSDNSFDRIYCESVLAILEGKDLPNMLLEIKRVLKPTGILLFNETIWTSAASPQIIQEVNDFCKANYGIIQSTADFPHLSDWQGLLQSAGFEILEKQAVGQIEDSLKYSKNWSSILSRVFSFFGKLRHGSGLSQLTDIRTQLDVPNNIMEGIIIKSKAVTLAQEDKA